jgi:MoaA/NifB/PqqE/SkfB family radical SAM enzyme
MNIDNIKKIELEITSNCNAACPGCARTQNIDLFDVESFYLEDIKRLFPTERYIANKQFKFCGVLGDPALNKDGVLMTEYLANSGGYCQWSTNGAYQTVDWWSKLGKISKDTELVDVSFCVDGHKETNHIYRVGTKWNVLERNMQAYSDAGGKATWIFIVFDHNEYELEAAREHAKRLGFTFATRTGMRNSYHDWVALIGKKNQQEKKVITTTGKKEHSKKAQVEQLDKIILENKVDEKIINTIKCKLIHEGEIFISAKQELWPCCFLWDSAFKNKENILDKLSEYSTGWNSLKTNSIEDVLVHPWFDKVLSDSWDPTHSKHITRCIRTCAYNKAYQNEIQVEA